MDPNDSFCEDLSSIDSDDEQNGNTLHSDGKKKWESADVVNSGTKSMSKSTDLNNDPDKRKKQAKNGIFARPVKDSDAQRSKKRKLDFDNSENFVNTVSKRKSYNKHPFYKDIAHSPSNFSSVSGISVLSLEDECPKNFDDRNNNVVEYDAWKIDPADFDKLRELLKSWKAPSCIFTVFKDTPFSGFKEMSKDVIFYKLLSVKEAEKFSGIFMDYWKRWHTLEFPDQCNNSVVDGFKQMPKDLKIRDILLTSDQGKVVLRKFEDNNFKLKDRDVLASLVVDYIRNKKIEETPELKKTLAKMIVAEFPGEEIRSYYYYTDRKYYGKLYNKFKNDRDESASPGDRKAGRTNKKLVLPQTTNQIEERSFTDSVYLKRLKAPARDLDEYQVIEHWKQTVEERKNCYYDVGKTFEDVCNEVKYLKMPYASQMLEIDYNNQFGESSSNIFDLWHIFEEKIDKILGPRLTDDCYAFLKKYDLIDKSQTIDAVLTGDSLILFQLFLIVPEFGVVNGCDENQKFRRLSCTEIIASFIKFQENESDIFTSKTIDLCQPRIVVIGNILNIREIIVRVGCIKYRFSSVLKAINFAFITSVLFHTGYNRNSSSIWQFIQKFFYKISLEDEQIYTGVSALLSDFKNVDNGSDTKE